VVRAAVHIDQRDAHIDVISDPLPQILQGIPLRPRTVGIDLDRPGFMLNPTGCGRKQTTGTLESSLGARSVKASPFRVRGCSGLAFSPRMTVAVTGRGRTTPGRNPGLRVKLTQDAGEANARDVGLRLRPSHLDQRRYSTRIQMAWVRRRWRRPKRPLPRHDRRTPSSLLS
jgi:hypothetical protein